MALWKAVFIGGLSILVIWPLLGWTLESSIPVRVVIALAGAMWVAMQSVDIGGSK